MSMSLKEVSRLDFFAFKGLFESCERDHATTLLEDIEFRMGVAAYQAGSETAFDSLEQKMDFYRFILGRQSGRESREKGPEEFAANIGLYNGRG